MATRIRHELTDDTWFITFTCYAWIPLFEISSSYQLVYNWLKFISDKYGIKTLAFVIMPNHVHLLLQFENDKVCLNTVIGNGKRFMAYAMIDLLTAQHDHATLLKLLTACTDKEKSKGQKHKVFEASFDAKSVYSFEFLYQKLDYIHHNPVSGKWNLCNEFVDYPHSSAGFYEFGVVHPHIDIVDYRESWF
jgi:REP element-mobilizing transposase RayT